MIPSTARSSILLPVLALCLILAGAAPSAGLAAAPALAPAPGLYLTLGLSPTNTVYHLETSGSLTAYYARTQGSLTNFAFDPNGTLYYSDANDTNIYKLGARGEEIAWQARTYVRDVGFDARGELCFSHASGAAGDGQIYCITAAGATELLVTVRLAEVGGSWAGNFAFDSAGALYVSSGNTAPAAIYRLLPGPAQPVFNSSGSVRGFEMRDASAGIYYSDGTPGGALSWVPPGGGTPALVFRVPAGQVAPDVKLFGDAGPVPVRFQGTVTYTPGTLPAASSSAGAASFPQAAIPQAGVIVNLFGYPMTGGPAQLLDSMPTLADGSYDVGTLLGGFDHFELQKALTRGVAGDKALGPASAVVLDPSTVSFGGKTVGAVCCTSFGVRDPIAVRPFPGPKYLIITRAAVVPVLNDFVAYKQFQGFNVIVKTVEDLDATGTGANRREKIRNYEKSLLGGINGLQYVLLIGTDATIPYLKLAAFGLDLSRDATNHTTACGFTPWAPNTCGWPSDWYYVDLKSNWDSNGDGVIGEQFWPDSPADRRDQPPAFHPDVFVGRIQMDAPASVQTALEASMRFERDSSAWKSNALLAGAMMDYPSTNWDPPGNAITGTYKTDTASTDQAYLMERVWNDILSPQGFTRTRLYEKQHPPTAGPPDPFPVNAELTEANYIAAWTGASYGLVNIAGHGAADGVVRRVWTHDFNGDAKVENPLAPPDNRWELEDIWYATRAQWLPSPNGTLPVLVVMACDTGDALNPNNLPTSLMARGQIAAWTGGSATVGYVSGWTKPSDGWAATMDYNITDALIRRQMPLGKAVWTGLSEYAATGNRDWGLLNWDFYGDPSAGYFGAGPDMTTPWPMFHRDWPGTGVAAGDGPAMPMASWVKGIAATPADQAAPSPVVDAERVVLGDAAGVVRAYEPASGDLLWSYATGGAITNAAALAGDGTAYVKAQDGYLYALDASGALKWKRQAGDGDGSPKISGDGTIYVGGSSGAGAFKHYYLRAYRPNGALASSAEVDGRVSTAVAIGGDNSVWAGTANGTLYHFTYTLAPAGNYPIDPGHAIGNGLALKNSPGRVIVPSANNRLVAVDFAGSIAWSFPVASAVTGAPALDAAGNVYFGTHAGEFYAVSLAGGAKLWQTHVGAAADSAPALDSGTAYLVAGGQDGAAAQLYALRLSDGEVRWTYEIGGLPVGASAPALGSSRTLYVATTDGRALAVGQYHWFLPPVILKTIPKPGEIQIIINPGDPAAWTQVERRFTGGEWGVLGTLQPGITSLGDGSVRPGVSYEYRALAFSPAAAAGGQSDAGAAPVPAPATPEPSDYSAAVSVMALPAPPATPAAPTVTPVGADVLDVSWGPVDPTAETVTLLRQDAAGGPFNAVAVLAAGTGGTTDTGLLPGHTYAYALLVANSGGSSQQGPSGSGTTFTQNLPPPSNVTVTDVAGGFRVCWQPGQPGLSSVVARLADGETEPKVIATMAAGAKCATDTSVFPGAFVYKVKHVAGQAESPWGSSARHEAPNFGPGPASAIYLPLLSK